MENMYNELVIWLIDQKVDNEGESYVKAMHLVPK